MYNDENMLMLSGVQHYVFCPRQWALITLEQEWADNYFTIHGRLLHQRVDDPRQRQVNNGVITLRGVYIASKKLGLYGIADAIELKPATGSGINYRKLPGLFLPYPVEYKRGHNKSDECDLMQLVCQVMCLEEMYNISISEAALFYWQVHRREEVLITNELRSKAVFYVEEMHRIFNEGRLPKAELKKHCDRCSLQNACMPQLSQLRSVKYYLEDNLYEETT